MINALGILIMALLAGYLFFYKRPWSAYILLAVICVWFFIIMALYFPNIAALPLLYFENVRI